MLPAAAAAADPPTTSSSSTSNGGLVEHKMLDDDDDDAIIEPSANTSVGGDDTAKAWEQLALLNTLIAITGIYYEQGAIAAGDGMDSLFSVANK